MTIETAERTGVGLGRGGRMSRQRKRDAVLRMLRGEDLEILSRALGVTVYRPRLVRHRIECYAASAAGESWFCRTAAGVWNPCRSMSQVVL